MDVEEEDISNYLLTLFSCQTMASNMLMTGYMSYVTTPTATAFFLA